MHTDKQELTEEQEQQLLHMYDMLNHYGISTSRVAELTGLGRTSLTNSFKALEAKASGLEPASRNRFNQADYQKLTDFMDRFKKSTDRIYNVMLLRMQSKDREQQ